jgi:hypothetical protein
MIEIRTCIAGRLAGGIRAALQWVAAFLQMRLEARDEDRLWRTLAVLLGILSAGMFLTVAFARAESIADDGRAFISWMGRWNDPGLLAGDLMADYWSSVSPWAYRGLFHAAWAVGIEPAIFIRLLPAILYPLTALFAYRFLRAIGADPLVAFIATACSIALLVGNEAIASGTPRAFWPVLLLAIMEGLARRRPAEVTAAQLLLAGMYPQMALVSASVIGLTSIKPSARFLVDVSRERIGLVLLPGLATIAGLLPFLLSTSAYGPAFSLEEARAIPAFAGNGRASVFAADGSIDMVCGLRLGFLSLDCAGWWQQAALMAAIAIGPCVLLARNLAARSDGSLASPLPFYLLASTLAWFAISTALLFRLHLPSRFSSAASLLAMLAAVPLLASWIRDRLPLSWLARRPIGQAFLIAGTVGCLCAAIIGAVQRPATIVSPRSPALLAAIRALPKDDMVAGFIPDLDFSPAFTGRSTLFNRELAVAYQKGYFLPILARMAAIRDVAFTRDPAVFAARLAAQPIDWLLVPKFTLSDGRVLGPFRGFFGSGLAAEEEAAQAQGPPVLAKRAGACTAGEYDEVLMLDAACLKRQVP